MKNLFRNKKLMGLCLVAAIFVSCKHPELENKEKQMELKKGTATLALDAGVSVKTPDWTKNPKGKKGLPSVKDDGSASNVNAKIMAGIQNLPAKDIDVKNVIFMFFDNLTEELITSTEEKYGELITNDLPQKMSFTAATKDENTDREKVIGLYLTGSCYKKVGYATNSTITNSVFRQFKGVFPASAKDSDPINTMLIANPRPVIVMAKDTPNNEAKKECAKSSSSYVNEIYKSSYKYTPDFAEAVACYNSDKVFFEGFDQNVHTDIETVANGILNIFDSSVTAYPSAVQYVKFGLAWTETKADPEDGFAFVFYDSAENADKEAALKNFDEAVAVATKYVLENPDTILVVTSAALDGSTIPAYILGNGVEEAKNSTNLLDFVKTMFKED